MRVSRRSRRFSFIPSFLYTFSTPANADLSKRQLVQNQDVAIESPSEEAQKHTQSFITNRIDIVSSSLQHFFPAPGEGSAPPAAAVIVFPSGSIESDEWPAAAETPSVYLVIHTSDTGECPLGQSTYLPILHSNASHDDCKSYLHYLSKSPDVTQFTSDSLNHWQYF